MKKKWIFSFLSTLFGNKNCTSQEIPIFTYIKFIVLANQPRIHVFKTNKFITYLLKNTKEKHKRIYIYIYLPYMRHSKVCFLCSRNIWFGTYQLHLHYTKIKMIIIFWKKKTKKKTRETEHFFYIFTE